MPLKRNEPIKSRLLGFFCAASLLLPVFLFGGVPAAAEMASYGLIFLLVFLAPSLLKETSFLSKFVKRGIAAAGLWLVLQAGFFAANPYAAQIEILRFAGSCVLFLSILHLEIVSAENLLKLLALAGVAEAFYGLFQIYSGSEHVLWAAKKAYTGFVTGTYINRNHLAGFLEMALGLQMGILLAHYLRKKWTYFMIWLAAFFICLFALLKTGSRMGILAFGITAAIYFAALIFKKPRIPSGFFISLCPVIVAGVLLKWDFIYERFHDAAAGTWSLHGRLNVWDTTRFLIQDHAWTGTGLGSFEWVYPQYQAARSFLGWSHAHNDYLELAAGLGLPVFALLLIVFIRLYGRLLSRLADCSYTVPFALAWGALSGATALAIHGLGDFNFAIPANRLVFIACLALAFRVLKDYRYDYKS